MPDSPRRLAAVAAGLVLAFVFAVACTSNLLTPIGGAPSADASSGLVEAGSDGALRPEAGSDAFVQSFGDAAVQEAGAASVDAAEVIPLGPSDGGPFTFLDAPFLCGASACSPDTHYCLHILPEGGLTPEGGGDLSDQCLLLPAGCSPPSCACVEGKAPCEAGVEGEGCVEGAGIEVSCPTF